MKRIDWTDYLRRIPSWIKGGITLITAVIGFLVLIQGNVQLGIIVFAAFVWIGFLGILIYLSFARTEPLIEGGQGLWRYEKIRNWSLMGSGMVIVIAILLLSIKNVREYITFALFPNNRMPTMEQTLVSKNNINYKLDVVIHNPSNQEILITKMEILFANPSEEQLIYDCCVFCLTAQWIISDSIRLSTTSKAESTFVGSIAEGSQPEYQYPVEGIIKPGCYRPQLINFTIDTSIELKPNVLTKISLVIPQKFEVFESKEQEALNDSFDMQLDDLFGSEQYCVRFILSNSKEQLESCKNTNPK